jgi:hypothetical protein
VATLYSALELRYNSFHVSQPASSSFPNVVSPSCLSLYFPPAETELPEFGQFRSEPSEFRVGVQKWVHPRVCSQFLPSSFPSSCGYFYHPVITRPQKNYSTKYTESFMHKITSKTLSSTMTNDTAADKSAYLQLK